MTAPFELRRITGSIGAEVIGLDLARDGSAATIEALKRALDRHYVLAVRGQSLTPEGLHALRARFGAFSGNPVHEPMDGLEDVMVLAREADETGKVIGEDWHMDLAWLARPPGITMLYADVVPPVGGDTCFTSLELAYKALSEGMRKLIAPLVAVHSGKGVLAAQYGSVRVRADAAQIRNFEVAHPLVCVNPGTGEKYLFVSSVIDHFEGMTPAESKPIVDHLLAVATRPEFNCRLRWEQGTIGMWLNPCVLHTAVNDYAGHRRRMYRTTVEGWDPVPAAA
jgi:taurine dioxygenase